MMLDRTALSDKIKKQVKKTGNRKRRRNLKNDLAQNPNETHYQTDQVDSFNSSKSLNGIFDNTSD